MSDVRLRFASFNIRTPVVTDLGNYWPKRKAFVAETIRDVLKPDVIGLQECDLDQATYLAGELPEYEWAGVGRSDGREKGEMVPIFHRRDRVERLDVCHFWLSETPEVAGSKSWLTSLPRMVTWARFRVEAREFCFFNAHFDHVSPMARKNGASLLRSRVDDVAPVPCVVAGDFNAAPGKPPYVNLIAGGGLIDHAPADAEGTFHGFSGKPGSRIDWLLTTPHWQDVTYAADRTVNDDGRYPSDHFPILIDATLPA